MTFDKLVYREAVSVATADADPACMLTVDFRGIGELTLKSGIRGEVNWRRITRPVLDVLRAKFDACDFEAWRDDYSIPAADGPGWRLELFDDGKTVKQVSGGNAVPEQWPVFQSILELCGALAENRRQPLHSRRVDARTG